MNYVIVNDKIPLVFEVRLGEKNSHFYRIEAFQSTYSSVLIL